MSKECPECGYKLRKKRKPHGFVILATECPSACAEFDKCRFNHDVSGCYWCNKCKRHYYIPFREKVLFV